MKIELQSLSHTQEIEVVLVLAVRQHRNDVGKDAIVKQ